MLEQNKLNPESLEDVTGGAAGDKWKWVTVKCAVKTGYLALRTLPAYNDANIIAEIQNNTQFKVTYDHQSGDYIYASYAGKYGWVNKNYIKK